MTFDDFTGPSVWNIATRSAARRGGGSVSHSGLEVSRVGFSDLQSWTLAQPDAPQLARRRLLEAVDEAGPDVELVEGSLSDDSDEPIPSTEDEICYAIRYRSEDGLRRLLTALGMNDVLELVGTVINCEEDRRDHARAACRRSGAAQIVLLRERDSWTLIAEFAEDALPNNVSWPTPVAIAQYVAAALNGIADDDTHWRRVIGSSRYRTGNIAS